MSIWSVLDLRDGDALVVTHPFTDFDGTTWPVGTRWTFTGYDLSPHDDGYTLHFVEGDVRLCAGFPDQLAVLMRSSEFFARQPA